MKIGIPQGLLYSKYHTFAKTFLEELGAEIIVSQKTSKRILDEGVSLCVDEACLPIKVYHGHVSWLKDKCDALFIPRFMGLRRGEYICPMFCGIIEMLTHSIKGLPPIIGVPIFTLERESLLEWAVKTGAVLQRDGETARAAFTEALRKQLGAKTGINDARYPIKVGLIGHPYNISDVFVNMDLKNKLNRLGIGVMTYDSVGREEISAEVRRLFKKPFWSLAQEYYGAAVRIRNTGAADGLIYLSSFSCGIDSVVTELIKNEVGDFPFMVLKLDEHTGEAGFDTRLDAFSDMLKRRSAVDTHVS